MACREGACPTCGRQWTEEELAGVKDHACPTEEERKRELREHLYRVMTARTSMPSLTGELLRGKVF